MPPNDANDHDLLVRLDQKVDSQGSNITELNLKVDSLLEIRQKMDNVLSRLNGHVPEKCIRHDDSITRLDCDITRVEQAMVACKKAHAEETLRSNKASLEQKRWSWSTVFSAVALAIAAGIPVLNFVITHIEKYVSLALKAKP